MRVFKRNIRAFTLLEMLIVVAVIGILATLLLGALSKAKQKAQRSAAKAHLNAIKSALAMYEADVGRYPRLRPRPGSTGTAGAYDDDAVALYRALMNKPTLALGGGPNAPYMQDWKGENVGLIVDGTRFQEATMGWDPGSWSGGVPYPTGVTRLDQNTAPQIKDAAFQQAHLQLPPANGGLVLLDPWGNPFHYREWASIRNSTKDNLMQTPVSRTIVNLMAIPGPLRSGDPPIEIPVPDRPNSPETYDIWCNGANGINEFGHPESDDVSSWTD